MAKQKTAATPKVAKKGSKQLQCYKNAAGKWVYPQGSATITLLAPPKTLGSNQLVMHTALQQVFGKAKTMPLSAVTAALAKARTVKGSAIAKYTPRRIIRRAGRANSYTFAV